MELTNNVLIVCTRNRADMLVSLLRNISQCECIPAYVVVVDSSDVAWTEEYFNSINAQMPFELHYLASRSGLPYQRNVGISYAQTNLPSLDFAHFLDDDVEVPPEYFLNIERAFGRGDDIVAVGAYDSNHTQNRQTFMRRILLLGSRESQGTILKSGIALAPSKPEKPTKVQWLPGFGINVRFNILGAPNSIWDGSYRMYGEDVDACLAIKRMGALVVDPKVHLKHYQAPAQREGIATIHYQTDAYRLRLALEHPDLVRIPAVIFTTVILFLGESVKAITPGRLQHKQAAIGHLRFLKDFVLRRTSPQTISHDYEMLTPIKIFS